MDRSLSEQYLRYMGSLVTGDLGTSFYFKQQVLWVILERLPTTLLLVVPALILSSVIGVWLGAVRPLPLAWWLPVFPGMAITLTVLELSLALDEIGK